MLETRKNVSSAGFVRAKKPSDKKTLTYPCHFNINVSETRSGNVIKPNIGSINNIPISLS